MAHPLSRTDVRVVLAVVALVGVIGAGAFMLGGAETSRAMGRGLAIAVVPPVEHEVLPGETMEVGALNDGFDRAVLDRPAESSVYDGYLPPDAYAGELAMPRMPMPSPVAQTASIQPRQGAGEPVREAASTADPLADGSHAFGFDKPRPDYAGDRALRWSRMDAPAPQSATVTPASEETVPVQYSSE